MLHHGASSMQPDMGCLLVLSHAEFPHLSDKSMTIGLSEYFLSFKLRQACTYVPVNHDSECPSSQSSMQWSVLLGALGARFYGGRVATGQGKVREIPDQSKIREKSGKFGISSNSQGKREFHIWLVTTGEKML